MSPSVTTVISRGDCGDKVLCEELSGITMKIFHRYDHICYNKLHIDLV